jgi:hypothetical protein
MAEEKIERKFVGRRIVALLGAAIVILSAGLLEAIVYYTSLIRVKDDAIAAKDSQIDSLNLQIANLQDQMAFLSARVFNLARENYLLEMENEQLRNENIELKRPNVYIAYWWWCDHPSTPQSHADVYAVLFNSGMESTDATLTVYLYDDYGGILNKREFPVGSIDGKSGKYVNFTVYYSGDAKDCIIFLTWS